MRRQAGHNRYRRTADDFRGGTATGTVTFTYVVTLQEIVLYTAADNVAMAGNWSRVADPTWRPAAPSCARREPRRREGYGAVGDADQQPHDPVPCGSQLSDKLWGASEGRRQLVGERFGLGPVLRRRERALHRRHDDGAVREPRGVCQLRRVGMGLGRRWLLGAVNKNGVLLRFDAGPQVIVIQTREDGVSIDQVVLSAA